MIVGRIDKGATPYLIAQDVKRVARLSVPAALNVAKGSMYLDGQGGGVGAQVCRQVIYDGTDNLLAVSDEVSVARDQAPGWVDFAYSLYGGGLALVPGDIFVGIFAGGYTDTIRVYGDDPHGAGGKWNADTYADGVSNPFGAATGVTADLSCYLTMFTPFADVRPLLPDLGYSRLPFRDAQAVLGLNGPDASKGLRLVEVGWHDTFMDPETGSVALVRDGSELTELLGERIKLTTGDPVPRSVVAYVHNLADSDAFDWDLSLSRHLFAQLGMLAADTLPLVVEVLN